MVMGRRGRVHGGYGKFVEKDLCLVESCLPVSFFIRELLRISLFTCCYRLNCLMTEKVVGEDGFLYLGMHLGLGLRCHPRIAFT